MKKIFSLLITILLLSSCSIDWNDEKDKRISELEKQVVEMKKEKENDLFKKKQECAKYKDEIEKYLDDRSLFLEELFYSKVSNGCFFVGRGKIGTSEEFLFDYFSQKQIAGYLDCSKSEYLEQCNIFKNNFEEKLKELKGE